MMNICTWSDLIDNGNVCNCRQSVCGKWTKSPSNNRTNGFNQIQLCKSMAICKWCDENGWALKGTKGQVGIWVQMVVVAVIVIWYRQYDILDKWSFLKYLCCPPNTTLADSANITLPMTRILTPSKLALCWRIDQTWKVAPFEVQQKGKIVSVALSYGIN